MTFFSRFFGKANKQGETKLPEGWTETQVSPDSYKTHIPNDDLNMWKQKRREKDGVKRLLNENGFHDKRDGRTGTIYYVESGKICEIEYEISGTTEFDILLYFEQLKEWFLPDIFDITENKKSDIKEKLKIWLSENKISAEL